MKRERNREREMKNKTAADSRDVKESLGGRKWNKERRKRSKSKIDHGREVQRIRKRPSETQRGSESEKRDQTCVRDRDRKGDIQRLRERLGESERNNERERETETE